MEPLIFYGISIGVAIFIVTIMIGTVLTYQKQLLCFKNKDPSDKTASFPRSRGSQDMVDVNLHSRPVTNVV